MDIGTLACKFIPTNSKKFRPTGHFETFLQVRQQSQVFLHAGLPLLYRVQVPGTAGQPTGSTCILQTPSRAGGPRLHPSFEQAAQLLLSLNQGAQLSLVFVGTSLADTCWLKRSSWPRQKTHTHTNASIPSAPCHQPSPPTQLQNWLKCGTACTWQARKVVRWEVSLNELDTWHTSE